MICHRDRHLHEHHYNDTRFSIVDISDSLDGHGEMSLRKISVSQDLTDAEMNHSGTLVAPMCQTSNLEESQSLISERFELYLTPLYENIVK